MCGGTKKTYITNQTGLGDQQFNALMSTLEAGGVDLSALEAALGNNTAAIDSAITALGTAQGGIDTANLGIDTANTGIGGLLTNVGAQDEEGGTGLYGAINTLGTNVTCLLYTSPSPRDQRGSRMPSSA